MLTLTTFFNELLTRIEPSADRLDAAKKLPDKVRDFLKSSGDFRTKAPHSLLTGSYRRHTAVGDIKDVDILVSVDQSIEEKPSTVINRLKSKLDDLPEELDLEGYAEVTHSRRSVHVYFQDSNFHLDVVPAIVPGDINDTLYIPDKKWGRWIESCPIGYCKYLSELNAKYGGKVVPLIKLLKHFRDYQMKTMKPKSYWLEALVINQIEKGNLDMDDSIAELIRDLMKSIYGTYACLLGRSDEATPSIADPMLGNDISWNWDRSHFESFMKKVKDAEEKATVALNTDNQQNAIKSWQGVFGDGYFPTEVNDAASRMAKTIPGVAVVSGCGLVHGDNYVLGKHVMSRPTKFYGDT